MGFLLVAVRSIFGVVGDAIYAEFRRASNELNHPLGDEFIDQRSQPAFRNSKAITPLDPTENELTVLDFDQLPLYDLCPGLLGKTSPKQHFDPNLEVFGVLVYPVVDD